MELTINTAEQTINADEGQIAKFAEHVLSEMTGLIKKYKSPQKILKELLPDKKSQIEFSAYLFDYFPEKSDKFLTLRVTPPTHPTPVNFAPKMEPK